MTELEYSNREIDKEIMNISKKLDDIINSNKSQFALILLQTTEHNHRMTKIEMWRSLLVGSWVVVTLFVIPLVVYASNLERDGLKEKITANQQEIKFLQSKD